LSDALADGRRRIVVSALVAADDPVPITDIVDRTVEEERAESTDEASSEVRRRIRTSLVQVHLPKLAEVDVAALDDEDEAVLPLSSLGDAQALLEPTDSTGGSI
jgi:hypothetical protein